MNSDEGCSRLTKWSCKFVIFSNVDDLALVFSYRNFILLLPASLQVINFGTKISFVDFICFYFSIVVLCLVFNNHLRNESIKHCSAKFSWTFLFCLCEKVYNPLSSHLNAMRTYEVTQINFPTRFFFDKWMFSLEKWMLYPHITLTMEFSLRKQRVASFISRWSVRKMDNVRRTWEDIRKMITWITWQQYAINSIISYWYLISHITLWNKWIFSLYLHTLTSLISIIGKQRVSCAQDLNQ